jgi:hypothetical protein
MGCSFPFAVCEDPSRLSPSGRPCHDGSVIRRAGGQVQKATGIDVSTFKTQALTSGTTYYWQVTAVGDSGKTASTWQHFKVK